MSFSRSLILIFVAAPVIGSGLRITAKDDPARVEVSIELPKSGADKLPVGKVPQEIGEEWLQLCLLENGKDGPPMLGAYQRDGQKLAFTPRFALQPEKAYHALSLESGKVTDRVKYTVPARPPAPLAEVVAVWPTADVLPANHLRFYIQFSRPMRGGPDIFNQIYLLDAEGQEITDAWLPDELWNDDGTQLTLYIHPGRIKWGVLLRLLLGPVLEPDRRYTLVISGEMLDADGRKLAKAFRKQFRTTAEDRTRIELSTWKVEAPEPGGKSPVTLTIPKTMDHVGLKRYLTVVDAAGKAVTGRVEVAKDARGWKFTPDTPWTAEEYRIVVDAQLEDTCGNSPMRAFDVDGDAKPLPPQELYLGFRPEK